MSIKKVLFYIFIPLYTLPILITSIFVESEIFNFISGLFRFHQLYISLFSILPIALLFIKNVALVITSYISKCTYGFSLFFRGIFLVDICIGVMLIINLFPSVIKGIFTNNPLSLFQIPSTIIGFFIICWGSVLSYYTYYKKLKSQSKVPNTLDKPSTKYWLIRILAFGYNLRLILMAILYLLSHFWLQMTSDEMYFLVISLAYCIWNIIFMVLCGLKQLFPLKLIFINFLICVAITSVFTSILSVLSLISLTPLIPTITIGILSLLSSSICLIIIYQKTKKAKDRGQGMVNVKTEDYKK